MWGPFLAGCLLLAGQSNASFEHADELAGRHDCVIQTAVGGTGIESWVPGAPLYERMLGIVGDRPVRAVVWVQGEHDASRGTSALKYAGFMLRLELGLRKDLGAPLVVTLLPSWSFNTKFSEIRRAQLAVIYNRPGICLGADPDTALLDVFPRLRDHVHYSPEAMRVLARDERRGVRRCLSSGRAWTSAPPTSAPPTSAPPEW